MKRPIIISSIAAIIVGGAAFAPATLTPTVNAAPVVAIQKTTSRSDDRKHIFHTPESVLQYKLALERRAEVVKQYNLTVSRDLARRRAIANAQALANARRAQIAAANAKAQALIQQPQPVPAKPVVNNYTPSGIAACIAHFESGGNAKAHNPSGADGLYQFMDGTWANYDGYAHASDAPASVQTEKFYQVWAGGAGAGNWTTAPMCGY